MTYTENVNEDEDIEILNPGFDGGADWIPDDDWSVGGGVATLAMDNAQFNQLTQFLPALIQNNWYDVTFTISNANFSGDNGIKIILAGEDSATFRRTNGTHTIRGKCGNLVKALIFENENFDFPNGCDIDNVVIEAIGTDFHEVTGIDHRTVRGAVRYGVPDGDKIYHALSYKDKTNCYIKYTP